MSDEIPAMKFTGERFIPEVSGNIELEHLHRYYIAKDISSNSIVLDIACGEGYGANIIAEVADKVYGVDIDQDAINHASSRYKSKNIEFLVGSCINIPLIENSVDVIVCFETIEHISEHHEAIKEFKRVMKPNGRLLISSPDKLNYNDKRGFTNEFHVKELYKEEFHELIESSFSNYIYLDQKVAFGSVILAEGISAPVRSFLVEGGEVFESEGVPAPMYRLALASDAQLDTPSIGLFEQPINDSEVIRSWEAVMAVRDAELDEAKSKQFQNDTILKEIADGRRQINELAEQFLDFRNDILRASIRKEELISAGNHRTAYLENLVYEYSKNTDQKIRYLIEEVKLSSRKLEEIDYEKARADMLERLNQELFASTSWKITAPLRFLKRLTSKSDARNIKINSFHYDVKRWFSSLFSNSEKHSTQEIPIAVPAAPQLGKNWSIICTPHTLFIAQCIQERLEVHGVSCDIRTDMPSQFSSDFYCILCAQMFDRLPPGERRVVIQLEQSVSSRWFTEEYLKNIEQSFCVIDYSLKNIEFLASRGIKYPHVFYLPIGGSIKPLVSINVKKEYDFIFYGDVLSSPRRQRLLNALGKKFSIKIFNNTFGEDMANAIRKAKAVINIHYYENALLETPRIQECLSLGVPVLSEASSDRFEYPEIDGAVRFFDEGSECSMLEAATEFMDQIDDINSNIAVAQGRSADRFTFMFDRFLVAIGMMQPQQIANKAVYLPVVGDTIALSLPETIERRKLLLESIPENATIFDGIRCTPGWKGAAASFCSLARDAKTKGLTQLTIFEDDVLINSDFFERLPVVHEYLSKNSGNWDVFCGLISDLHKDTKVINVETFNNVRFVTIDRMVSMVYNIYGQKALSIISNWDAGNDDVSSNTIDRFIENHDNLRVVVAIPFLVGHREDTSSTLWGFQNSQYSPMISDSEHRLIQLADDWEVAVQRAE